MTKSSLFSEYYVYNCVYFFTFHIVNAYYVAVFPLCVYIFIFLYLAYQPFVRSCRERHVCPFFHTLSLTCISVLTIYFYVGRVSFITMRNNGTFPALL